MNKAKRIISLLPPIEEEGLRDPAIDAIKDRNIRNEQGANPDLELADWIDKRLAKCLPGDQDIYDEMIALRNKLRKKAGK